MKLKLYSVYDSKVGAYMTPFFMRSKGEALRGWQSLVNDGKSAISTYPGDFNLYEIGEFDDENGAFCMNEPKVSLGTGLEFKNKPEGELPLLQKIQEMTKEK